VTGYLVRRLAAALFVLLGVTVFLSVVVHLIPGDPVRSILGPRATPELSAAAREEMGLDRSVPGQVWMFVDGVLHGDLGNDFLSDVPVTQLIGQAIWNTFILAFAGLGLATLLGVLLGVLAATRPNSILDRVLGIVSVSLITVPAYLAGLILLLVFAVHFKLLPATGQGAESITADPVDYVRHLILPAVALALGWTGYIARLVRSSMIEVLHSEFIRTMEAYGVPRRVIVFKYALKNGLIPTIAVLGVALGSTMGGAIFIEVIFNRPGLGNLIFKAIEDRNFPIVRGGVFVIAAVFILANLAADLSYRFLDPRVSYEGGEDTA